jgi:hypothetical protein
LQIPQVESMKQLQYHSQGHGREWLPPRLLRVRGSVVWKDRKGVSAYDTRSESFGSNFGTKKIRADDVINPLSGMTSHGNPNARMVLSSKLIDRIKRKSNCSCLKWTISLLKLLSIDRNQQTAQIKRQAFRQA